MIKIENYCPRCKDHRYIKHFSDNWFDCERCSWEGSKQELIQMVRMEPETVLELMYGLTDDERNNIFSNFCRHCGGLEKLCYCNCDD